MADKLHRSFQRRLSPTNSPARSATSHAFVIHDADRDLKKKIVFTSCQESFKSILIGGYTFYCKMPLLSYAQFTYLDVICIMIRFSINCVLTMLAFFVSNMLTVFRYLRTLPSLIFIPREFSKTN